MFVTIKLRKAVDESTKSFITEDVLYKDLRAGSLQPFKICHGQLEVIQVFK